MGKPGLLADVDSDLAAIASAGVTHLITLTEGPFDLAKLRSFGIRGRHFPIRDMGVPALGSTARLCREIQTTVEDGGVVAVHCHAGLGRTGTILAAMKVWLGAEPDEAVDAVRQVNPGYIQSRQQLAFVRQFHDSV
jgi:atypical dual specificity phosphatase